MKSRIWNLHMNSKIIRFAKAAVLLSALSGLAGCQFQPLYGTQARTTGPSNIALSQISVAEVDTREAQQVRNHLIFLLSGGARPVNPSHEVRLRVATTNTNLATAVRSLSTGQIGNTAGSVNITASYEIYDLTKNEIIARGNRETSASYDQTSQSFATERARRDAENRAGKAVAEQLRLAISSDFNKI
jgi:LPS-assembly lipoprotein